MALPTSRSDREYKKFVEDGAGNVATRVALVEAAATVPSTSRQTAVDETAAVAIKASGGQLYGWNLINPNAYDVYVKFYNTAAGSVVVGTTAVVKTLQVPAGGSVFLEASDAQQTFSTAIAVACTKLLADADTTAITTDIYAEIYYI